MTPYRKSFLAWGHQMGKALQLFLVRAYLTYTHLTTTFTGCKA